MACRRELLCVLVLITNIYYGLPLSININETNYHTSNLFIPNISSNTLSIQNEVNQNITIQNEDINNTLKINLTESIDDMIKLHKAENGSIKYNTLKEALNGLQKFQYEKEEDKTWLCSTCYYVVGMVSNYIYYGGTINEAIETTLRNVCTMVVEYESESVCSGIISHKQSQRELEWIFQHRYVSSEECCTQFLGNHGCQDFRGGEWVIDLPPVQNMDGTLISQNILSTNSTKIMNGERINQTHDILIENDISNRTKRHINDKGTHISKFTDDQDIIEEVKDSGNSSQFLKKHVLKVLHITDPHYDPDYQIGSNAACHAPLCCNNDSGEVMSPLDAAGKWGDYRYCDSPKWLLENMYQHIAENHPDIDYIMNTGDLVPHHIWKVSQEDSLDIIHEVSDMMLRYFPNIPIYSTVGNHDSAPVNSFPPPETDAWSSFNVQWLYDALDEQWSKLMHQDVPHTAKYAGYYSVLARPAFRIISINTNYCYRFNWWLLYKSEDPGEVLKWLTKELESAEAADEKVHIIGHIHPLHKDCFQQWGLQFSRIVSRFSNIIRGQFYGHSHYDEFRLHYDINATDIPVGVEYITPNNGPFKHLNPAYRIFYVDGEHENSFRDVLDYETWVMNLTHANLHDDPHWYHLYSARHDLNMETLLPEDWNKLVKRMAEDKQLFDKYYRYRVQDSDSEIRLDCDEYCQREILCKTVDGNKLIPNKC